MPHLPPRIRTHRLTAVLAAVLSGGLTARAADWPQWRGPDRSNVSQETGLRAVWPKDGPPVAWTAAALGDGVAPVSVAGGRVFLTGNVGDEVVCTALAEKDGKPLWTAKLGPAAKEMSVMRWLSQTAPTVDGNRVFAVTANGDYLCLAADTGKVVWRKHFVKDFEGKKGSWGFCDYPLADGDNLIVTPGGQTATVAALNKATGELVWACPVPGGDVHGHAVLVPAEVGRVRQYVTHLGRRMVGVAAADGKLLWTYDGMGTRIATTYAPVVRDDVVFYASGYGVGHALLRVGRKGDVWAAEEVYREKINNYIPWLGSPTRVGDHVFVNTVRGMNCLEWKTGRAAWTDEQLGRCTYTVADGKLFIRTQTGRLVLAAADPKVYKQLAEFKPQRPEKGQPAWTFPVVANGRLYVREYETLHCYDVRAPDRPRNAVPDAVFVPTPPDVVAKMLELAAVTKNDVVYDLGSGDGRIVIAAATTYGCRAVGVELDRELVTTSLDRVKEAGINKLATVEHGDLFEADFSGASVVALYILPAMSQKLIPKFDKLKPGSRIVSHCFAIPGITPAKVLKVTSSEDDVERPVYLYTVPLMKSTPGVR